MVVAGLWMACAAGCGLHQKPALRVASMRVADTGLGGTVITVVVEAENYGGEPLELGGAAYDMTINGETAYAGQRMAPATVPSYGTVRFELPVPVESSLLAAERVPYAVRGVVEYIPPGALGEALFDARVRRGSASFAETGEFIRQDAGDETRAVPESAGD